MPKKAIVLLLICLIALSGCEVTQGTAKVGAGTQNRQKEEIVTTMDSLSLIYYTHSGANPLTGSNLANQKLYNAVYTPLITYDESLKIINGCAKAYTVHSQKIQFTLDTSRKFSDGSYLNAGDVIRSFNTVLSAPESAYYRQLSNVSGISGNGSSVTVSLKAPDPNAIYCMDIPIVKTGGSDAVPVFYGTGPYKIGRYQGRTALIPNPNSQEQPSVDHIFLLMPENAASLTNMFNSGVLDILPTDLLTDNAFSSSRNYNTISYLSNKMIYLGGSQTDSLFSDAKMRLALSELIPRNDIVKTVLMSLGQATVVPFYPKWDQLPSIRTEYDDKTVLSAFTKAGFTEKNGQIYTKDNKELNIKLLVCNDNKTNLAIAERIKSNAASLGIRVNLDKQNTEAFNKKLSAGEFQLYIASYKINKSLNPTPLYSTGSGLNFGKISIPALDKAYTSYAAGQSSLKEYLSAFEAQMPIIPVAFTKDALFLTKGITTDKTMSFANPLGNLSQWSVK